MMPSGRLRAPHWPHGSRGADGFAVSLVTPDTRNLLRNIQKFTGQEIPEMNFRGFGQRFRAGYAPTSACSPTTSYAIQKSPAEA